VTSVTFDLKFLKATPAKAGTRAAVASDFYLRPTQYNEAMVSSVKTIQGPQDVELELNIKIFHSGLFAGSSKALIFLHVTENEF
jgi:fibulin 1/2